MPDGRWNCSVQHWSDYRQHFPCNLVTECVGGEDEAECPYTSDVCGQGLLWTGISCMQYISVPRSVTWVEAQNTCLSRGMLLASLNTPPEWRAFRTILNFRPNDTVYLGYRYVPYGLYMYQETVVSADGAVTYWIPLPIYSNRKESCSYYSFQDNNYIAMTHCYRHIIDKFPCEIASDSSFQKVEMPRPASDIWTKNHVTCPSQHVTHTFLACDVRSDCWEERYDTSWSCSAPVVPVPPAFTCDSGAERVPYTLVCDHRADCSDRSDEDFCQFPACNVDDFHCDNGQCILQSQKCDHHPQCYDQTDEKFCSFYPIKKIVQTSAPPGLVEINNKGLFKVKRLNKTSSCPETHFQCPNGYCVPVYVRCNGVFDCPGKGDEADCETYTCPGYYRCRGSRVCVHADHLCDTWPQCQQADDELLCNLTCPDTCVCHGLAFTCTDSFPAHQYLDLKFLDARGSAMTFSDLSDNTMLIHLSLAQCGLTHAPSVGFPNLRSLDLSDNLLHSISSDLLDKLPRLETLSLADNPLTSLLPTGPTPTVYSTLHALDLSGVKIPELNDSISKTFPNIRHLNLTNAQVERVTDDSLLLLTQLQTLDLRGCPLSSFSSRVFRPLSKLHAVYADTYRMCCPANLPENFDLNQCVSPPDRISSCDSLLGSTVLRASVSVYTIVAVTGNTLILLHHTYIRKVDMAVCFNMLLIHLCVADLMMGVYLTIISVADQAFLGHYLWMDVAWRNGAACRLAGFLAVLSRQASAFIVCLITLDRLLAIVFPVSSARFRRSAGWMVCTMSWVAGLCVASLSVLQAPSSDTMYSQSGLCIPLPTDRLDNWKEIVALKVVFVFNLLLVLLIVFGNVFIFWRVFSTNLLFSDTRPKSRELIIARRVNLLDAVDATCWCINLFGLLPFLSSNVGVNLIIFVLPLPSVLNPSCILTVLFQNIWRKREKKN
ncbi:G-protein coupled receptor GRL101-like [Pomacea canaliculata]|uniref:G-protein coupled receptor GRL101-like n=1 Tax=Pomacea canaliculata TaxID=400727 RepID=UPI000D731D73|nr:G-protein coupled receptor GRL101-like [Pomacea canaliculata]